MPQGGVDATGPLACELKQRVMAMPPGANGSTYAMAFTQPPMFRAWLTLLSVVKPAPPFEWPYTPGPSVKFTPATPEPFSLWARPSTPSEPLPFGKKLLPKLSPRTPTPYVLELLAMAHTPYPLPLFSPATPDAPDPLIPWTPSFRALSPHTP